MCFADDFRVQKDWHLMVHQILRKSSKSKFFIVHQKPHPPTNRPFANIFKFNQLPTEEKFEELIGVDEAPGWSSNLIKELGNFGPVAATDSWTLSLERRLQERKLNITYFTKKPIIKRVFNEDIDSPKAERWHTQRKHIFSKISSNSFEQEVSHSVEAINTYLGNSHFKNFVATFRYFYYLKLLESIKTKIVLRNLVYFKYLFAESTGAASPIVLFQIKNTNLVCYQNYFYLIPHSLGKINFNQS